MKRPSSSRDGRRADRRRQILGAPGQAGEPLARRHSCRAGRSPPASRWRWRGSGRWRCRARSGAGRARRPRRRPRPWAARSRPDARAGSRSRSFSISALSSGLTRTQSRAWLLASRKSRDRPPRLGLGRRRHRILEIEDQRVRARRQRLLHPVRPVAGHEQERAQLHARASASSAVRSITQTSSSLLVEHAVLEGDDPRLGPRTGCP